MEGINTFEEKETLFDAAMTDYFGEKYNSERGTVQVGEKDGKPFYVNVQVKAMKMKSDRTQNTVGIRVYMFKRESSYTIGEYAGKISIDRLAKRIQIIGDTEISK